MATYDELRHELQNLDGLYGADSSWRRLLTPADVRAVDGYLNASTSTVRYEQSPTGQWEVSSGSTGQLGYLDPDTHVFYPAVTGSTGDAPQVPDALVGVVRNEYTRALHGGPLTLPSDEPFLRTDEQQRGDAADAIKSLERAMVLQQDDVADADLRLAEAVMQAHSTAEAGNQLLDALQTKIDDYIRANPGLDTPAGAREFQRFLIGVMDEIAGVVSNGSLDAASLEGIVTSLAQTYRVPEQVPVEAPAAVPEEETPTPQPTQVVEQPDSSSTGPGSSVEQPVAAAADPVMDELLGADPAVLSDTAVPAETAQAAVPATSSMPNLGGLGMPSGLGTTPSTGTSSAMPSIPNLLGGNTSDPLADLLAEEEPVAVEEPAEEPDEPEDSEDSEEEPSGSEEGGTVVTLPNGEKVTAPTAEIAGAITAAAEGTPVAEAYLQNGMVITPAGTAVEEPVDTADVITGDVGVFSDHHVIALGDSKALVNTSVEPVDDVVGPGFLGWEHPPEAEAQDVVSAPTRVAAAT